MSNKDFKNINGEIVKLEINEKKNYYKEITLYSSQFNIKRWFLWSLFFYLIGSYFQLHYQDIKLMVLVISILLLILLIKINSKIKQESLLVVASVGVQLTTTFMSGRTLSMFYNIAEIKDIVINEAITMHRVLCYLCLLRQGCASMQISDIIPLFTFTWPSLTCLKVIRKELRPHLTRKDGNSITSKS